MAITGRAYPRHGDASPATVRPMAYDERLAARVRDEIAGAGVTERRMFGGLAFLICGNMAVAVSGRGGLLVRADPARAEKLLSRDGVRPMEMRGRPMAGWLCVDDEQLGTARQLRTWVAAGAAVARALPAKAAR